MPKLGELPVGSKVKFGTYDGSPISWVVIDHDHEGYPANSTTVLSEYLLGNCAFSASSSVDTDWETSVVREFLNSEAFDFNPKSMMLDTNVKSSYVLASDGTYGVKSTTDTVFLLAYPEMFNFQNMSRDECTYFTCFGSMSRAATYRDGTGDYYWSRSAQNNTYAQCVSKSGGSAGRTRTAISGVRPATNLNSDTIVELDSDGYFVLAPPPVNKVEYYGKVLLDLTGDTLTDPSQLKTGVVAHTNSGAVITGTYSAEGGTDTSDATAQASDIRSGQTAYVQDEKVTGTMPDNGAISRSITSKAEVVGVPAGYHDGNGTVRIDPNAVADLTADALLKGKTVLGIEGTHEDSAPEYDTPTIEVSTSGLITATANGKSATEQLDAKGSSDLTASGATVTVPAGWYGSGGSKSISTATQATPGITVSSAGLITASATQTAGYVTAGTKSATQQLTTQAGKTVTPTKSQQTAVASGSYTTGAVNVAAIPAEYIVPSGSQTLTENKTFDVTSLAEVVVNVAGSGGGLPTGIADFDYGTITVRSAFTTSRQTFQHKLGVVPDLMILWAPANIATTYSMLAAIRGNQFGWRSSAYNNHMAYHGNSTTNVSWTNSSSTSYGISNMTATSFQLASSSSSYYWRAGTYNYIAIKFS